MMILNSHNQSHLKVSEGEETNSSYVITIIFLKLHFLKRIYFKNKFSSTLMVWKIIATDSKL